MFGWPSALTSRSLWLKGVAGNGGSGTVTERRSGLDPRSTRAGSATSASKESASCNARNKPLTRSAWTSADSSTSQCGAELIHRMPCQAIRSLGWVEALLIDDFRTQLARGRAEGRA